MLHRLHKFCERLLMEPRPSFCKIVKVGLHGFATKKHIILIKVLSAGRLRWKCRSLVDIFLHVQYYYIKSAVKGEYDGILSWQIARNLSDFRTSEKTNPQGL